MTATSTEQSTDNSCAFLKRPPLRFRNVLQTRKEKESAMALREEGGANEKRPGSKPGSVREYLHRTIAVILDGFDLNLSSPHRGDCAKLWLGG